MFRNRIAMIALGLLLVGFQSTSPAAVSQEPQQDQAQVSAKGGAPVPDDAVFTPLPVTSELAMANRESKAEQHDPGRLLELQSGMKLPASAGTGGGDLVESEPNNTADEADAGHDLPFQCVGEISYGSDRDYIRLQVTQGVPIEIDVFANIGNFSSPLDPGLVVLSSSYEDIARNDDVEPGNLNSRVNFVAPYSGMIYILVKAVRGGGPGHKYIVAAWPTEPHVSDYWEHEPNRFRSEANPMVLPGVKCGTIASPGDVDMVSFEGLGGAQIIVDLHARSYNSPLNSVVELIDYYGDVLFVNDDADSERDSRFNLILPYTGQYFVRVSDFASTGGAQHEYILSVSLQDRVDSPVISKLKFTGNKLKKVGGYNFVPGGTTVEISGSAVPSVPSVVHPTTIIKVKPPARVRTNEWVTVVNGNGRRSNPYVRGT